MLHLRRHARTMEKKSGQASPASIEQHHLPKPRPVEVRSNCASFPAVTAFPFGATMLAPRSPNYIVDAFIRALVRSSMSMAMTSFVRYHLIIDASRFPCRYSLCRISSSFQSVAFRRVFGESNQPLVLSCLCRSQKATAPRVPHLQMPNM